MSVKHIGLVLDHFEAPPALKLIAVILADHADSEGVCFPSYRHIARRANISERSVQRHIKELQARKIITRLRTGTVITDGEKRLRISNAYRVNAGVLIKLASKSSTDSLGTDDTDVYLQDDTSVVSRSTPVSTKPSYNHQSNRQHCGNVDNQESLVVLADILKRASEQTA